VWLWRVSMTVSREMPAGRGVRVVKTVRFDILKSGCNRGRSKKAVG
jgi:hypothetical protein